MSSSGALTLATPVGDVYTCEPVELQWTYSAASGTADFNPTMVLTVNRFRSPENGGEELGTNAPVPPPEDMEGQVLRTLSTSIAARDGVFEWAQVDLPSGTYYLSGRTVGDDPTYATSRSFQVNNGSDTSCVVDDSPGTTDTNTGTPTGSPSDTSDPGQSSPPPSTTGADTQPTIDPETHSATSSSSVNTGAIAGGVVAGVVALVVAALILFLCRRRHRNRDHSRRAQHGYMNSRANAGLKDDDKFGSTPSKMGGRKGSKWTGLGSVDLKFGGAGKEATTPTANSRRNSTNPLTGNALGLTSLNREPGAVSPTEDDDAKYPLGGESASSLGHGVLKLSEHDAPFAAYTPRRQSLDQDRNRSSSQPTPPSLPTSPVSPTESYPSHNYAHHPNRQSFHGMPMDASNGGTGPRKKAPRKPVPAYSGAEPVPMGISHGSLPSLATGSTMMKSSSYGSTSPIADSNDKTQFSPQLESSLSAMGLGGKDVHYLIPDMPVGYQRSQGYGKQGGSGEDWQAGRR